MRRVHRFSALAFLALAFAVPGFAQESPGPWHPAGTGFGSASRSST